MDFGGQGRTVGARSAAEGMDRRFFIAARCGLYLLMGTVMACARVLGNGAPFGMALVACSGAGISGVFSLLGACCGYLFSGGLEWGVRYIAASVLVYTVAFVFHELSIYKNEFFMPTAAALVMGLTGFLGSFALESGAAAAAALFLELTLAFGGTYFFRDALDSGLRTSETAELKHGVSLMVMASCALMALSRVVLFGVVSMGRFFALLLVMTSAMKGGMLTGAAVGTVLGLAMDIAGGRLRTAREACLCAFLYPGRGAGGGLRLGQRASAERPVRELLCLCYLHDSALLTSQPRWSGPAVHGSRLR